MTSFKLARIHRITGSLVVRTGLRIGGSQDVMEISGLDNPIIRNPRTAEPFIPGSSLRGRMRSLAEWYFGELPDGGEVIRPKVTGRVARVFGVPARDPKQATEGDRKVFERGPTRLIVRDGLLTESSRTEYQSGVPLTEVKSENSINRLTSMANPRPMERVLPGVSFEIELVYRVFDIGDGGRDDERAFEDVLLPAMRLLELDALGGGGSRGNGKVEFRNLQKNGEPLSLPDLDFTNAKAS